MTLAKYEVFSTVVERGSLTKAAVLSFLSIKFIHVKHLKL
jgi:hypothetical protein